MTRLTGPECPHSKWRLLVSEDDERTDGTRVPTLLRMKAQLVLMVNGM